MRFLCTCDCRKAEEALETAQSKIRRLEADFEDLFDRLVRLQGRFGARVKAEAGEPGGAPRNDGEPGAHRGNPLALELLAKRRGNVSG